MALATFVLRLTKRTQSSNCFREAADRVGRIYLHPGFIGSEKLSVEITADKALLSSGGYHTTMVPYKVTANKVRYVEDVSETGELGDLYVSKKVLNYLGVREGEAIAVRLSAEEQNNASARAN